MDVVRRVPVALACLAAVLALAACSDGSKKKVDLGPTPGTTSTPAPVIPSTKPVVTVPTGPPPKTLVTEDLIVGTGDFAIPGKTATINYVGVHYSTGKEFDSTWRTGHPFPFQLGAEEVVPGWDQGVVGMRVGGRRRIVIPPDLGWGAEGDASRTIGPNETVILVVDLISIGGRPAGIGNPPASSS